MEWTAKWWETHGILQVERMPSEKYKGMVHFPDGACLDFLIYTNDWKPTRGKAVEAAKRARLVKINKLRKEIERLKSIQIT